MNLSRYLCVGLLACVVLGAAAWGAEPKAKAGVAARDQSSERGVPARTLPALELGVPEGAQTLDLGDYYPGLQAIERVGPALAWLAVDAEVTVTTSSFDARATVVRAHGAGGALRGEITLVQAGLRFDDGSSDTAIIVLRRVGLPLTPFRYKPPHPGVREVMLLGSFNDWNPGATPMRGPELDGTFRAELALAPGEYGYEFLADGVTESDRENPPAKGGETSSVWVEATGSARVRLLPVPGFDAATSGTARLMAERGRLRGALVLAGNRLIGRAVLNQPAGAGGVVGVELEEDCVVISGLERAEGLARDGAIRVLALTDGGAWAEGVIQREAPLGGGWVYQIVTDRFANGDPGNDRPLRAAGLSEALDWRGGDWAGVRAKIEAGYFEKLGVGTITLSPPDRQSEKAEPCAALGGRLSSAFRGVWPISNEETEPRFGTAEALSELVEAAHAHGLRVLLELNANQIHWDHLWRRRWPEYINKQKAPDGSDDVRRFAENPQTTWEEAFLPDVGYGHDANATAKMVDAAMGWLRRSGADGFRHERPGRVAPEFWSALTRRLEAESAKRKRPYWQLGEGGERFDAAQRNGLLHGLISGVATQRAGLEGLQAGLEAEYAAPGWTPAVTVESLGHADLPRLIGFTAGGAGGAKAQAEAGARTQRLALGLFSMLPGMPALLYGEEIGLGGRGATDLRMMRFGQGLEPEERATLEEAMEYARLRKEHAALRLGAFQPLYAEGDVLAFARVGVGMAAGEGAATGEQAIVVVINRGAEPRSVQLTLPRNLQGARGAEGLGTPPVETKLGSEHRLELTAAAASVRCIVLR